MRIVRYKRRQCNINKHQYSHSKEYALFTHTTNQNYVNDSLDNLVKSYQTCLFAKSQDYAQNYDYDDNPISRTVYLQTYTWLSTTLD